MRIPLCFTFDKLSENGDTGSMLRHNFARNNALLRNY
jgi:hypothetical protein